MKTVTFSFLAWALLMGSAAQAGRSPCCLCTQPSLRGAHAELVSIEVSGGACVADSVGSASVIETLGYYSDLGECEEEAERQCREFAGALVE